jgi:GNAT superfamily N-acetyltransferase
MSGESASQATIIAAIETNTVAAFVQWGRLLDAEFPEESGVSRFVTGLPFQFSNAVVRARFDVTDADERIQAIRGDYAARGAPMSWLVSPSSAATDLATRLEAQGMTFDSEAPGMAIDLHEAALDVAEPDGVTIHDVSDGDNLARWIETMVAGSELPDMLRDLLLDLYARHGFRRQEDVRYFLAMEGERPVATALLFLSASAAGVYNVATLLGARKRGIGMKITATALRAARDLGHRLGVLQSSEMGYSIYWRLGFREYCRFRLYFG